VDNLRPSLAGKFAPRREGFAGGLDRLFGLGLSGTRNFGNYLAGCRIFDIEGFS
jgi:hypothetical protein